MLDGTRICAVSMNVRLFFYACDDSRCLRALLEDQLPWWMSMRVSYTSMLRGLVVLIPVADGRTCIEALRHSFRVDPNMKKRDMRLKAQNLTWGSRQPVESASHSSIMKT